MLCFYIKANQGLQLLETLIKASYFLIRAMASISTSAPLGSLETSTQDLAGQLTLKYWA
jgi:hypothetical protein